jgi:hypothetical protein
MDEIVAALAAPYLARRDGVSLGQARAQSRVRDLVLDRLARED